MGEVRGRGVSSKADDWQKAHLMGAGGKGLRGELERSEAQWDHNHPTGDGTHYHEHL